MNNSLNSTRVKALAFSVSNLNLVSRETNEPSSPNSSERVDGDRIESVTKPKTQRLLVCKHPAIFSTFNVCSLSLVSRKQELLSCFSKFKIDVLSIQEHRFLHKDIEFLHS
eukprot:TCONS_00057312-protein